ncbi:MAG TPA: PHP domain-containing protein [Polyangiaceae bacterium]|jgi:DNA polymerase (family 10)|nr:PHP domain-containing protein [Polyangiaceae bacterium]
MQNTSEVSRGLREIAALLEFSNAPKFKVKAYQRAAEIVETVADLAPWVEQGRLEDLEGIGTALSHQIEELWNTGNSRLLNRLRSEQPQGASELVQLEGMTPRRLHALVDGLGIHSVSELRVQCADGHVQALRGFGEKTERRLLEACDRWLERGEQAPLPSLLPRALERAAFLEQELLSSAGRVQLVGDLRRGQETVRALEWVVLGDASESLRRLASLRQVLRVEPEHARAHLSEALKLQLHSASVTNWGNVVVLATGNAAHTRALRQRAAELGFSIQGWDAATMNDPSARTFATEHELYAALGLSFVPPELRQGQDELSPAVQASFDQLVAEQDIRGMVHCHTTYSDGKNSIVEMAAAAHALGMQYLTITDHSPSAHYAHGVSLDRLKQQWDEIAAAQEGLPIRILRGTESDILADGHLDYPDSVLEQFEVVIASIHTRHRMDRPAMTARLIRAMSLPIFKIWGHGLGRILNHRDAIDCDVPAVLDALAGSRGAIELNSDPHRLDLPPEWIPAARERKIPFVISVDAHSTRGLGVLRYGATMARRGGLARSEVLNTQSAERFAALVRPTRIGEG